jgi:hypothetical protein
MVLKEVRE